MTKYNFPNIDTSKKGVYMIVINTETYIGYTNTTFQKRWANWINQLANNYDCSPLSSKVQEAVNKCFTSCPINKEDYKQEILNLLNFSILEEVEDNVKEVEKKWIKLLKPSLNLAYATYSSEHHTNRPKYIKANPVIRKQNYKKAAIKRASITAPKISQKLKQRHQEEVLKPIEEQLDYLDTSNYVEGKWKLCYKNKIWRFKNLKGFCRENNLPIRVFNKISQGNYKTPCNFTLSK